LEANVAGAVLCSADLVSCDTQGIGENACIVGRQEDLSSFSRRTDPKRDVAPGLIRHHAPGLDVPDAVQATRDVLSPEGQVDAHRFGATGPSSYSRPTSTATIAFHKVEFRRALSCSNRRLAPKRAFPELPLLQVDPAHRLALVLVSASILATLR